MPAHNVPLDFSQFNITPPPLEVGFDKIVCRKCGIPCLRCTVCLRRLYRLAPHNCTQTVDKHLTAFCLEKGKAIDGCVRVDRPCCPIHNGCKHEFD